MKHVSLLLAFLLFAFPYKALAQRSHMPTPPSSMDPESSKDSTTPVNLHRKVNLLELQREAEDLARTAQTIPLDMANVRNGTLPKDFVQKLKQIEKISKHLRTQISH